jgi:transaldolase/glucose-6-phosphate isomerase
MIGPDTVNTIPPATFDAFRDHGKPRETLTEGVDEAKLVIQNLAQTGISIDRITDKLTDDGVHLFEEAFDKLLAAVEKSTQGETTPKISLQSSKLPDALAKQVAQNVNDWRAAGKVRRLWQRDASLWTNSDESHGRLQPVPRSPRKNLRPYGRLSQTQRTRFDRSRPSKSLRKKD